MEGVFGDLFAGSPNYGKLAAKNEKMRQSIINLGMGQINAVYGGGTAPFYNLANANGAKFDPHNTYYNLSSAHGFAPYWVPGGHKPSGVDHPNQVVDLSTDLMTTGGAGLLRSVLPGSGLGSLFGSSESPKDIARKNFNRGNLYNTPNYQTFEGFQPSFYDQRAKDYENFALPQEAQQYRENRLAMLYNLGNRGLSDSSVAEKQRSNLEREAGRAKQTIADTALEQANQLRRDVEQSRQQAIGQLYQTADPSQATSGAISTAAGFRQPSTFAPIANMFSNLYNTYQVNQALNSYRQPYGISSPYSLDMSGAIGPTIYGK